MRILLVDDEQLIREGMAYLLGINPDVEIVGQASNGQEAVAMCNLYPIDIVLMDIRMPLMNGVSATKLIKEAHPQIKILVLTTFKDEAYIQEAVAYGASGYLLKDSSPQLIYNSLKNVMSGGFVLAEDMAKGLMQGQKPVANLQSYNLTEREHALIGLIAQGQSNKEIGEALYLTEGTVKNSMTTLLGKLGLKDRTQIAIFAFKNGLAD